MLLEQQLERRVASDAGCAVLVGQRFKDLNARFCIFVDMLKAPAATLTSAPTKIRTLSQV